MCWAEHLDHLCKEKPWNRSGWTFGGASLQLFGKVGWCPMLFTMYPALGTKASLGQSCSLCQQCTELRQRVCLLLCRCWHTGKLMGFFSCYLWSWTFQAYSWLPQHCSAGRRGKLQCKPCMPCFLACNCHKQIRGVKSMCYLQKMMRCCSKNGRPCEYSVFQNKILLTKKITDAKMCIKWSNNC